MKYPDNFFIDFKFGDSRVRKGFSEFLKECCALLLKRDSYHFNRGVHYKIVDVVESSDCSDVCLEIEREDCLGLRRERRGLVKGRIIKGRV